LGQTLGDIEVICVDDGSTDGTVSVLQDYAKRDKRVRVVRQPNSYAGVARNNGMSQASGQYLLFFDADDYCEPYMLEKMVERSDSTLADICLCASYIDDAATGTIMLKNPDADLLLWALPMTFSADKISDEAFFAMYPNPWNKLFRAEFVKRHNLQFQATKRANDVYFARAAQILAERITVLSQPFVYYRKGDATSLTSDVTDRIIDQRTVHDGLKSTIVEHGLWPKMRQRFNLSVIRGMFYCLKGCRTDSQWDQTAGFIRDVYAPEFGIGQQTKLLKDFPLVAKAIDCGRPQLGAGSQESPQVTKDLAGLTATVVLLDDGNGEGRRSALGQSQPGVRVVDDAAFQVDGDYVIFLGGTGILNINAIAHAIGFARAGDLDGVKMSGTVIFDTPEQFRRHKNLLTKYRLYRAPVAPMNGLLLAEHLHERRGTDISGEAWLFRQDVVKRALASIGGRPDATGKALQLACLASANRTRLCEEHLFVKRAGDQPTPTDLSFLTALHKLCETATGRRKEILAAIYSGQRRGLHGLPGVSVPPAYRMRTMAWATWRLLWRTARPFVLRSRKLMQAD